MKKAFRLSRDLVIALGLFFAGSLWLTLVWPGIGAVFGTIMVLGGLAGAAKINIKPFSDIGVLSTLRTYFPTTLRRSEFRSAGAISLRLGLIAFLIPAVLFVPVWVIVKEVEKMQGYAIMSVFLGVLGLFFQIRGALLIFRSLNLLGK